MIVRRWGLAALACLVAAVALAAVPPSTAPTMNPNVSAQPVVIYDGAGNVVSTFNGGPATVADGADVAQGARADTAYTGSGSASLVSLLKGVYAALVAPTPAGSALIGAVSAPTAASTKTVQTSVTLAVNTSTSLLAANANRIGLEIQCDGTAAVGVDRNGGTLTSATAAPLVIPPGSYPLYVPPVTPLTAVTGYTGTAQACRVTEYVR